MYQVDEATAASTLPTPAAPGTAGFFTNGNPGTGVAPTIVDADILNAMMLELINIVEGGGVALSKTSQNQAIQALRRLFAGNVTTLAVNTTLTTDNAGLVNLNGTAGALTITLPAAAVVAGYPIYYDFVRTDTTAANTVTIAAHAGDTIDGLTSITIPVGAYRGVVCDGVGVWRTVGISPAPVAQCYFQYTSSTTATLLPKDSNRAFIPGYGWVTIPAAGILTTTSSCYINGTAAQAMATNTTYYGYLAVIGGAPVIDWSTTARAVDAATGMPIKTGDNTRLCIGMAHTNGSSQITPSTVISYWSQRNQANSSSNSWSIGVGTPTATATTVSFCTWGDNAISVVCNAGGSNSTAGDGWTGYVYLDGTAYLGPTGWISPTANAQGSVSYSWAAELSEGFHTFTFYVATATGGSASGSAILDTNFRG